MSRLSGMAAWAFRSPAFFKFAATTDNAGRPNVALILSARLIETDTIAFVRFMAWKTAQNLEQNGRVCFACRGPLGRAWLARGEFQGWETKGPLIERFSSEAMYRYNAYMGATHVGVVRVTGGESFWGDGAAAGIGARMRSARPGADGPMAAPVMEKWRRLTASKCIGMTDASGWPLAVPAPGLAVASPAMLTLPWPHAPNPLALLPSGAPLAAAVFCLDPSAFQVKGVLERAEGGKQARLRVSEVFAASPPIPGKRIFPPES